MAHNQTLHNCVIVKFVPPPQPPAKPSNKRHLITHLTEVETTTQSSYYDGFSGFTTQSNMKFKAEGIVDTTTGRSSFKEEVKLARPPQPLAKPSNKRHLITDCTKMEKKTRRSYNDGFNGFATQFDKKRMAEGFVDRTTGRSGIKEEVKCESTVKVEDRRSGCTDLYSTPVELKRVTYQPTAKAVPKSEKTSVGHY